MFEQLDTIEMVTIKLKQVESLLVCMRSNYFESYMPSGYENCTDIIDVAWDIVHDQNEILNDVVKKLFAENRASRKAGDVA